MHRLKYAKVKEYNIARVVLGTGSFGSTIPDDAAADILCAYVEKGGNAIDTANVYANWVDPSNRSSSEKWLGRQLRANPGLREKLIICTKGAHYEIGDRMKTPRVNEACITFDISDSLMNLGIDKIDLYWLHYDNPAYPVSLIMDALFKAQDEDKIGHYGASNWSIRRIMEANSYAKACGREGFFGSQIMYSYALPFDVGERMNLYFDEEIEGPAYLREQLALFCYTSQARGYITLVLSGIPLPAVTAHDFDCVANRERAERALAVAREIGAGYNAEQVGLAYQHSLPYDLFTIVGCQSVEELHKSVGSCDISLNREQLKYLAADNVTPPFVPQIGH